LRSCPGPERNVLCGYWFGTLLLDEVVMSGAGAASANMFAEVPAKVEFAALLDVLRSGPAVTVFVEAMLTAVAPSTAGRALALLDRAPAPREIACNRSEETFHVKSSGLCPKGEGAVANDSKAAVRVAAVRS
jgi:hypothetical protein